MNKTWKKRAEQKLKRENLRLRKELETEKKLRFFRSAISALWRKDIRKLKTSYLVPRPIPLPDYEQIKRFIGEQLLGKMMECGAIQFSVTNVIDDYVPGTRYTAQIDIVMPNEWNER